MTNKKTRRRLTNNYSSLEFVIRQSAIVIVFASPVRSVRGRPESACGSHPPRDSSGVECAVTSVPRRSDSISVSSASITLPVIGEPPPVAVLAGDEDLRHDVHLRRLDGFREAVHHLLGQLQTWAAVGADLLLDRHGLGDADARGPLGLGAGDRPNPLGLALAEDADLGRPRPRPASGSARPPAASARYAALPWFAWMLIDELRLGDERLLLGARLGLAQLRLLRRGLLLARVGLDLLLGDLARAELLRIVSIWLAAARRRRACRSAPPAARGCSARTSPSSPRREICWMALRSWISWISVRVWPMFLK